MEAIHGSYRWGCENGRAYRLTYPRGDSTRFRETCDSRSPLCAADMILREPLQSWWFPPGTPFYVSKLGPLSCCGCAYLIERTDFVFDRGRILPACQSKLLATLKATPPADYTLYCETWDRAGYCDARR